MLFRIFFVVLLLPGSLRPLPAQDDSDPDSAQQFQRRRSQLDQSLASGLSRLSSQATASDARAMAAVRQRYVIQRDPQRQYIFIPPQDASELDGLLDKLSIDIRQALQQLMDRHAGALYDLAAEQARAGRGATAFQLLHEVLFFAPDHEPARNILGHRRTGADEAWRIKADRFKARRATRPYVQPAWPSGTYTVVSTSNFRIVSQASEDETEFLAEQLERWHDIWRQVFFDYYQRSANLARWFEGRGHYRTSSRKFEIVFFANRDDYIAGLARAVPGVEVSTGYYHDGQQTSYFYGSRDPSVLDTWRHELAHQLFQETRRSVLSPFDDQFLWLGEGIALYFESITDLGSHMTLGGFDARRLQYARRRLLTQQFQIPIERLSRMNRKEFQSQPQIAWIYSQAAGLTHYLMTGEGGSMRQPLVEFLQLSYQGKLKPDSFERLIGKTFREIDEGYRQFLRIQPGQIRSLSAPATRTELALTGASLESDSLQAVGHCTELQWLDLSGCDVTGGRLRPLIHCRQLTQLFLAGSRLDAGSLQTISRLPIRELDLSGSSMTDAELEMLVELDSLRILDVSGTPVTAAGLRAFRARRPSVDVTAR